MKKDINDDVDGFVVGGDDDDNDDNADVAYFISFKILSYSTANFKM